MNAGVVCFNDDDNNGVSAFKSLNKKFVFCFWLVKDSLIFSGGRTSCRSNLSNFLV